ncbi:cysteine--tRNA ligase [Candidatus Woesearchaeota archaeon]|nr:MAG: cysteine--tRNA ligase [Candidatus Woesearchaeota archaeon]
MKLYNTLSRKKEDFHLVKEGPVRMYSCGPTVYDFVHIGNLRTFLFEDILCRFLEYRGFEVFQVKNLTDVDDKTIKGSRKKGVPLKEFTREYEKAFFEDCKTLRIRPARVYPRATEHIPEMVAIIKELLKKGFAYKSEDGIYFAVDKFKEYGKLAHLDRSHLKAGASGRVLADEYDKENLADFALWKFWDEDDGDVFWETEIGKGRPGWHIECSAMSVKYLTSAISDGFSLDKFETLDIHTGGVDLMFPHHEDEIAQVEAVVGKPFANFWLHSEHLLVDGKKMSKSLGNFYTLRDLLKMGYHPLAIRYALISSHYRQKLNFVLSSLDAASTAVQRINDFISRLNEADGSDNENVKDLAKEHLLKFENALDDDLEISRALASLFDLMSKVNRELDAGHISKSDAQEVISVVRRMNDVLDILVDEKDLPPDILDLLEQRRKAREAKDYQRSDELREELKSKGILVEDTKNGQRWKRIFSRKV